MVRALNAVGFKDVEEFYQIIGVIPLTHTLDYEAEGPHLRRRPEATDDMVVFYLVSKTIAGMLVGEWWALKLFREIVKYIR